MTSANTAPVAPSTYISIQKLVDDQTVFRALEDLKNIDVEGLLEKVKEHGILTAARIVGYDVSEYQNLEAAGRLLMLHQRRQAAPTFKSFFEACQPLIGKPVYEFVMQNHEVLQREIDLLQHNDLNCDWFSASTEYRQYLWKADYNDLDPIETVQYEHMRIAVQLYYNDPIDPIGEIVGCYKMLSNGYGTHASPTIFNACRVEHQMSSCFLKTVQDDLGDILYGGVGDGGMISKSSGGLGLDVSHVRHSEIGGTGMSQGIVPMLLLYNQAMRYVDQGGRRKGAATIYLRAHHIDAEEYIEMVDKVGDRYARAHDLNTAIWFPWIFWDRVKKDGSWTLFCPAKTPQLNDQWGMEFWRRYEATEAAQPGDKWYVAPMYRKKISAREFLAKIADMQIKAGMPYVMHGDACNMKSNQRSLGYICCGNLCLEIIEFTSVDEIASCNLASISLRMFTLRRYIPDNDDVKKELARCYDFGRLGQVTQQFVKNLNRVIDNNWYPLDKRSKKDGRLKPGKIRYSNHLHRPIGLGVSGFAEALHGIDLPFVDTKNQIQINPVTSVFNKMIFACIYFNSLVQSVQLAVLEGKYETFEGSPFSEGKLQFDLWEEEAEIRGYNPHCTKEDNTPLEPASWGQQSVDLLDKTGSLVFIIEPTWDSLKQAVVKFGTRNSLLTTIMPTATTAQKLRNCESTEAHTANLYSRKVMNGAYPIVNRYLVEDLRELGLWNEESFGYLVATNGSVKGLREFVESRLHKFPSFRQEQVSRLSHIQVKYLTMWEIPSRVMLRYAADRGRYIDQSQSTNIFIAHPTPNQLIALHQYTDMLRLKTGMYYLREQPPTDPVKFTADSAIMAHVKGVEVVEAESKPAVVANPETGEEICVIYEDENGSLVKSCCA